MQILHIKKRVSLSLLAGIAVCASAAYAVPIPGLFNTGVDDTGVPLTEDASELHYTGLQLSDLTNFTPIVATSAGGFPIGPWIGDGPLSAWITPSTSTNGPGNTDGSASFIYTTTFDLTGLDPTGAKIKGLWSVDNSGVNIRLNGTALGLTNTAQFASFTPFTISQVAGAPFVSGINTLEFLVNNGINEVPPDGPTGLRVEMTGTLPDPIPPGQQPISIFSTGVGDNHATLSPGTADPHWNVTLSADPGFITPSPAVAQLNHPAWVGNGSDVSWISITPIGTTNIAPGTFAVETSFDLTGLQPGTAELHGQFSVDNVIDDVLLNGLSVGISGGTFNDFFDFSITSGFIEGVNTLTWIFDNLPPGFNPGGIFISIEGTAITAGPPQWHVDADGSWGEPGNWLGGVPDSQGASANFLSVITAPRIITLDGDRTVSYVSFDNANSYTITGPGSLTLDNGGSPSTVDVLQGNHVIAAPVNLVSDTIVTIASGSSLSVQSLRGAGLTLSSGRLAILPNGTNDGTSSLTSLSIDPGATLDLADNDLVMLAAPGGGAAMLLQITELIRSGRNDGATPWTGNGISSSSAASDVTGLTGLGVIQNDNGAGGTLYASFDGLAVDIDSVLVKFTYNGDADLNGGVDADDYFQIDFGFASGGTLGGWRNGDFDYSGAVDADDYFLIDSAFAAQGGPLGAGVVAVPEPALAGTIILAGLALARRGRNRK